MQTDDARTENRGVRAGGVAGGGALKQFFGCVLFFLGLLNTMLTFKGGFEPDPFNYLLMLSGAIILAIGVWQSRE